SPAPLFPYTTLFRSHRGQVVPVDGAGDAGRFVGIAHAEEQSTVLQPPVESSAQVEAHRSTLELIHRVRLGHGNLVAHRARRNARSEEHTSELQSQSN